MKKYVLPLVLFLCINIVSCSKKPDPLPVWSFKKDAIILNYSSDQMLNIYDNMPHTLMVIIYELSDANNFKKFSQYEEGIRKLLNQQVKDPNILTFQRIFIEPGKHGKVVLDRVEKATWIGIVAGYYSLEPQKTVKTIQIPYKVEKKGLIRRKRIATIPTLKVNLVFTRDSIQLDTKQLKEKD